MNKSEEWAGVQTWFGNAWKPPAEGSSQNPAGNDRLAESVKFALQDVVLQDLMPIYTSAAISDNYQIGIDDQKSYNLATESPLAEK